MHESLRMYWLLKGMEWNHLPVAGGIYDQHPKFLDDMQSLMQLDNEIQVKKQKADKNKPSNRRRR